MSKIWKKISAICLIFVLTAGVIGGQALVGASDAPKTIDLQILNTTDLHMNLMDYDYYQSKQDASVGLAKTATLIKEARLGKEENTFLFDNGDSLQGTPLADYIHRTFRQNGNVLSEKNPLYRLFEALNYDAAGLGNHEFNYGLDFLEASMAGVPVPFINANVYSKETDANYFKPYEILSREVKDSNGDTVTINVGVTSFVPPQIMNWDDKNLRDKVYVKGIVPAAKEIIPQMKEAGADVIVVLAHTGSGEATNAENAENVARQLTSIDGVDVVIGGHSHQKTANVYNGVPLTIAGSYGNNLGISSVQLVHDTSLGWTVDKQKSKAELKEVKNVNRDEETASLIEADHLSTIAYVNEEIGKTSDPINSFFALVKDDPSVQLVNSAQKWHVDKKINDIPELAPYRNLPVLSVAAPFRSGPSYTNIPAGPLKIKNMADLYVYPNTVSLVSVTGAQIKDWLEGSAVKFNQIDVTSNEEQQLINSGLPAYNFDVFDGIEYEIDVTKPAKYSFSGGSFTLIDPNASRITNLRFNGQPLDMNAKFLVVTNNYRAGSANFPGVSDGEIVYEFPDENRQVIVDYINGSTISPKADNNWKIKNVANENLKVVFSSALEAKDHIGTDERITFLRATNETSATYQLNLLAANVPEKNKYKVTFETNGGTEVAPIEVTEGEKITKPTDPTKTGHKFIGWYTDRDLTKAFNFETEITDNITLYAAWEALPPTNNPESSAKNNPTTGDLLNNSLMITLLGLSLLAVGYLNRRKKIN